jgi:hypothetical protein
VILPLKMGLELGSNVNNSMDKAIAAGGSMCESQRRVSSFRLETVR